MNFKYGLPLNFEKWLKENEDKLKPPVSNQQIWADFHDDPVEEYFYQFKGNASLIIWEDGKYERVHLKEGDMFLMAPHVIHSPQRPEEGSLCLVIERKRPEGENDALQWSCASCGTIIKRYEMALVSIVDDLPPVYEQFYALSDEERTCSNCGEVHPGRDYESWLSTLKANFPHV